MLRIPRRFWNATMIRSLLLCLFLTLVSSVGGRGHALRLSFGLRRQGSRSTFVPTFVRTIVRFDLGCPTFTCHPHLQGQIDRWDERESPPVGWVGLHLNETGWHGRKGGKASEREREWTSCVSVPSVVGCQRSFLFHFPWVDVTIPLVHTMGGVAICRWWDCRPLSGTTPGASHHTDHFLPTIEA